MSFVTGLIKAGLGFVAGFVSILVLVFLILWLTAELTEAHADESIVQQYETEIAWDRLNRLVNDSSWQRDAVIRAAQCEAWNTKIYTRVKYIARQIVRKPEFGYVYRDVLISIHGMWAEECL